MNTNNSDDFRSRLIARLRAGKAGLMCDSRELGWSLGLEFLEDDTIDYHTLKKLVLEWEVCQGYEPWNNLLSVLDDDTGYRLSEILKLHEMDGTDLVYDEVAAGFFKAIKETWKDVEKEVLAG